MPPVRRLTAILAADVAGYSRLMGADPPDSPLEESGFEPSVQPRERNRVAAPSSPVWETECSRSLRWRKADSNHRSNPASATELRHLLARCGRPNVRGLIDEEAGFEPPVPTPTAVACLPISRFASSYPHRSPIRGLRSGFARLAGIFAALGFGKPSNSRTDPTSNILYVYIYGPLLMALLVHVVPPTQPSL